MSDITKLDLEKSQPKFISVGSNVFVSSTGKSEVCRKGQQGLFCRRHHGSSYSSQPEVRAMLDKHANRTIEKLSPFENGCIWLYSVLMRTTIEEARKHYIESTAMYTLLGVRKPTDIEVKGLQKALMGLIESSRIQDTRMDKLKKLVKNMAFGKGFTEAGFYTLKDMTKETLNKIKMGFVGLTLGSSLLLTGCAGQNPVNVFGGITSSEESVYKAGIPDLKTVETVTDDFGSYERTGVSDISKIKPEVKSGLSESDLKKLESFIFTFITEEALDSIALDNESQWDSWKKNVAPKYISKQYIDDILSAPLYVDSGDGLPVVSGSAVILADHGNLMPVLLRDGGTRSGKKMFQHINITQDDTNKDLSYVTATGYVNYFISDESSKKYLGEYMQSDIFDTASELNDGKPNAFQVAFNLSYTVIKEGDSYKIAGFNNTFDVEGAGMYGDTSNEVPDGRLNK